jgi:hypothetical protein
VGELAHLPLLKRGKQLRQGRLVFLPRLLHRGAVGLEHLALLGLLALAGALALGQPGHCDLRTVFPKVISGLRRPIAIQAAISLNMNLPE